MNYLHKGEMWSVRNVFQSTVLLYKYNDQSAATDVASTAAADMTA
jgi:hypothetical protein